MNIHHPSTSAILRSLGNKPREVLSRRQIPFGFELELRYGMEIVKPCSRFPHRSTGCQAEIGETPFRPICIRRRYAQPLIERFYMACLGLHFSLSDEEVQTLRSIKEQSARVEHVHEVIEEEYFGQHPERLAESDKAWDAMHRTLADGQLSWDGGEYPLNHVVLGGELLYTKSDFIMVLKSPEQVHDTAATLPAISREEFRRRYDAIDAKSYGFPMSDEDFGYTWDWFQGVRELFIRAASEGRYVLFTADQ